jgi:hypothetical protein
MAMCGASRQSAAPQPQALTVIAIMYSQSCRVVLFAEQSQVFLILAATTGPFTIQSSHLVDSLPIY